jgi:hypothetical protein
MPRRIVPGNMVISLRQFSAFLMSAQEPAEATSVSYFGPPKKDKMQPFLDSDSPQAP